MIGLKLPVRKRARDDAEKPFWISFADLMTALMVLFLVTVTVALFAVTSSRPPPPDPIGEHEKKIKACMSNFQGYVSKYPGVKVDVDNRTVDFGERARFENEKHELLSTSASQLREFAPEILRLADSDCGKNLFKRVVVEGYTSKKGDYLYNLDLSLKRAHSVVCALLENPHQPDVAKLDEGQKRRVRNLFMVGGYSSNAQKKSDEESRRVELRLEFLELGEKEKSDKSGASIPNSDFLTQELGTCRLKWRSDQ